MSIRIEELRPSHVPALVAFNQRLEPARTTAPFPVDPMQMELPKLPGRPVFREYYVAVDDEGAVRGAYILKRERFRVEVTDPG